MSSAVLELMRESVADWATSTDAMRHVPGLPATSPVPALPTARVELSPTREQIAHNEWRKAVYAWLVANRLGEPGVRVPVDARAWIDGRWIVCETFQMRGGKIALNDESNDLPPYVTVLAPLLVPPKDPRVWVWLGKPRALPPPLGRRVKRPGRR